MLIIQLDGGVNNVSQKFANGHQLCNWNFYTFISLLCLPLVDSTNELSSMIDFRISGMPTLTKRCLLEKLCHACGMSGSLRREQVTVWLGCFQA